MEFLLLVACWLGGFGIALFGCVSFIRRQVARGEQPKELQDLVMPCVMWPLAVLMGLVFGPMILAFKFAENFDKDAKTEAKRRKRRLDEAQALLDRIEREGVSAFDGGIGSKEDPVLRQLGEALKGHRIGQA